MNICQHQYYPQIGGRYAAAGIAMIWIFERNAEIDAPVGRIMAKVSPQDCVPAGMLLFIRLPNGLPRFHPPDR